LAPENEPDTRWECVLKTDSRARAHIVAGHLISKDIPAFIVPKVSSAYSFAVPGHFEVWVPLLKAPDAVSIIHDATGPLQDD
jgi:hypothetical protein